MEVLLACFLVPFLAFLADMFLAGAAVSACVALRSRILRAALPNRVPIEHFYEA